MTDEWRLDVDQVLSVDQEVIVMQVDGVGSWGQGISWSQSLVSNIGDSDKVSLVSALQWTLEHYHVDHDKIGLMGAEYGGYLALKMITDSRSVADLVSCVLVRSPITQWQEYGQYQIIISTIFLILLSDSFMTSKYFGSDNLTDNYRAHQRASLEGQMRYMRREVMMLVVSGMEDSRVDISHTMRLARVSYL